MAAKNKCWFLSKMERAISPFRNLRDSPKEAKPSEGELAPMERNQKDRSFLQTPTYVSLPILPLPFLPFPFGNPYLSYLSLLGNPYLSYLDTGRDAQKALLKGRVVNHNSR